MMDVWHYNSINEQLYAIDNAIFIGRSQCQ